MLVIDDTPERLGFLTDTLDHAGFTVLITTDAESALDLVDQIKPDLVLLNAVMPGMNRFETCRRLKRKKRLTHMPVIFMTALRETEHVVEGLAASGVDYVTKPIIVDELLALIRVHRANARTATTTHATLDASGRFLLATDRSGRRLWCTPKATQRLSNAFPAHPERREPAERGSQQRPIRRQSRLRPQIHPGLAHLQHGWRPHPISAANHRQRGMRSRAFAHPPGDCPHVLLPHAGQGRQRMLAHGAVEHQLCELRLVLHVVVQRHGRHLQRLGDGTHRKTIEAVLVRERQRRAGNAVAVEICHNCSALLWALPLRLLSAYRD